MELATFSFGRREKRGLIKGESLTQAISGIGLLVAFVLIINIVPGFQGFLVALLVGGVGIGVVFIPMHSRTIVEWTPLITSFVFRKMTNRLVWQSTIMDQGIFLNGMDTPIQTPKYVGRLIPLNYPLPQGGVVGVIVDRTRKTYTAVLQCRASKPFSLLDPAEQQSLLDRYERVLSSLAGVSILIDRIQWIDRTLPNDSDEITQHYRNAAPAHMQQSEVGKWYEELIQTAGPTDVEHEIFFVLRLNATKPNAKRTISSFSNGWESSGLSQDDFGACTILINHLQVLANYLRNADIVVDHILSLRKLSAVIRTSYNPFDRELLSVLSHGSPHLEAGTSWQNAWPARTRAGWNRYWTDDAVHATFWVKEWPKTPQYVNFMAPLLIHADAIKTFSLIMKVNDQITSIREVNRSVRSDKDQSKLAQKHGFDENTGDELQRQSTVKRGQQVHSGYPSVRFVGFITVSAKASDPTSLEDACGRVIAAALQPGIELYRLNTEHDKKFTATLPLGRGMD